MATSLNRSHLYGTSPWWCSDWPPSPFTSVCTQLTKTSPNRPLTSVVTQLTTRQSVCTHTIHSVETPLKDPSVLFGSQSKGWDILTDKVTSSRIVSESVTSVSTRRLGSEVHRSKNNDVGRHTHITLQSSCSATYLLLITEGIILRDVDTQTMVVLSLHDIVGPSVPIPHVYPRSETSLRRYNWGPSRGLM